MKKLSLFILVFVALSMTATAQSFSYEKTQEDKRSESIIINVDGTNINVHVSSSGAHYQLRTSKTGSEYKSYFGYSTPHIFDGKEVYRNKDKSKYWVLGLTKTGYIKKVYLVQ